MSLPIPMSEFDARINRAFTDYLEMGQVRSAIALHRRYVTVVEENPAAFVPTLDLNQLMGWERDYNWRQQAIQYDMEGVRAFKQRRQEVLTKLCGQDIKTADALAKKAKMGLRRLRTKRMTANDILKYITVAAEIKRSAQEKILAMEDPRTQDEGKDYFDNVRELGLLQLNSGTINMQVNVTQVKSSDG